MHARRIDGSPRYQNVEQAPGARPMHFPSHASLGSKDGREIAMDSTGCAGRGRCHAAGCEWVLKA